MRRNRPSGSKAYEGREGRESTRWGVVLFVGSMMGCGINVVGTFGGGDDASVGPDGGAAPHDGARGDDDGSFGSRDGDANSDAVADAIVSDVSSVDASTCAPCGPRMVCVAGACVPARRVFVSSTSSTAALGGVGGAEAKCRSLATAAGLGGEWGAWVSSFITSPRGRFEKATVPYRLVDGMLVANDWTDLVSGNLAHAIDRDETGALLGDVRVWTSTKTDGSFTGTSCNGFLTDSTSFPAAMQGTTSKKNNDWTNKSEADCDSPDGHIYCFEQ